MDKTITGLEAQKKNPNRINVYLDDEFGFGVSRYVGAWLREGDKISDDSVAQIVQKDAREKAFQKALQFINYRPRSEYEIKKKLSDQGFSEPVIANVIAELLQKNYIDDLRFALDWIESRSRSKPRSRRMFRYELQQKNISEGSIDKAVSQAPEDEELAHRLGQKYLRRFSHLDDDSYKKKMEGVLARRAFPYSVIREEIRNLLKQRNE